MALFNDPMQAHLRTPVGGLDKGEPLLVMGWDPTDRQWLVLGADGIPAMLDLRDLSIDWRWVEDRMPHNGEKGPGWIDLDQMRPIDVTNQEG